MRGVYRRKGSRYFEAVVYDPFSRRQIKLGSFETAEAAGLCRDASALLLHGETAKLNFPTIVTDARRHPA